VGNTHIFNHYWNDPNTFVTLGSIPATVISEVTNGLKNCEVLVTLNKLIHEYDHLIIFGPVFPHEVVGFSGGNKYFFRTGGKGMYKLEPAIVDGGEVVIYSPRITEVTYRHGKLIEEIGYHCRDYFLKQWERFKHYPRGVVAHSTHVKGLGSYDASTKIETPRITVTLATGISEERCRRINLRYPDPASVRVEDWTGGEDEGIAVIPRAGEKLYRLRAHAEQTHFPANAAGKLECA
jgi:nickel-dependent lactate racemase